MSPAFPFAPRTRGLTLVELLVALAAGLGVVLAAGRLALAANEAHAAQAEFAAIDDGGRYALEALGRALGQGRFTASVADDAPARIAGLDAASLARTTAALDDPLPDAAGGSDVLAVRFAGSGPGEEGDGSVLDCAGFPVAEDGEGWSIFYVARNGQGEPELRCKYRGAAHWSADAIVAGVDGFQVLYGIDTDTPRDGVPNRYVNAAAIDALDAPLRVANVDEATFNLQTWWKRVVSVRVGLLLHGSRPTRATGGTAAFDLLGAAYAAGPGVRDRGSTLREADLADGTRRRERRLFTATFNLPVPDP